MSGISTYLSVKMTQPPPQYILPPVTLPLAPVRPSLPPRGGRGDGVTMVLGGMSSNAAGHNHNSNSTVMSHHIHGCSEGRAGVDVNGNGGRNNHGQNHGKKHDVYNSAHASEGIDGMGDRTSPGMGGHGSDGSDGPQDSPGSGTPSGSVHSGSDAENVMSRSNQGGARAPAAPMSVKEAALRQRIMGRQPAAIDAATKEVADCGEVEEGAVVAAAAGPEPAAAPESAEHIHIGSRGNPVGSLGYKWWSLEDDTKEGMDGEGDVEGGSASVPEEAVAPEEESETPILLSCRWSGVAGLPRIRR